MKKMCSFCQNTYEAEFNPSNEYGGDFCRDQCRDAWLEQRGMLKQNGDESAVHE